MLGQLNTEKLKNSKSIVSKLVITPSRALICVTERSQQKAAVFSPNGSASLSRYAAPCSSTRQYIRGRTKSGGLERIDLGRDALHGSDMNGMM